MNSSIGFQYNENDEKTDILWGKRIKEIYQKLQDDVSKEIFTNRLMYSLSDNPQFMRNVILATESGRKFYEVLRESKNVYIYGAGIRGRRLVDCFPEIDWKGYIDRDKENKQGILSIIKLSQLEHCSDITIVVSLYSGYQEVREILEQKGFDETQIIVCGDYDKELADKIYFDECWNNEICFDKYFVDAGAYDGRDIIKYYSMLDGEGKNLKVIAFEPDKSSYEVCKERLLEYKGCELRNTGLYHQNAEVGFSEGKGEGSCLSLESATTIRTECLDDVACDKEIGYIKMDVEGAEVAAILGAKDIISKQKPKLAISIYHKRSDIWRIPILLLQLCPSYKFWLRHYTVSYGDTVLYADIE